MRGFVGVRPSAESLKYSTQEGGGRGSPEKRLSLQIFVQILFVGSVYSCSRQLAKGPFFMFIATFMGISAVIFCALHKPWSGRQISNRSALKAAEAAVVLLAALMLWSFGLRQLGPLRTLLAEGAEVPLLYLLTLTVKGRRFSSRGARGIGFLVLAYLLIALDASWTVPSKEINQRMVRGVRTRLNATTHRLVEMRHRLRHGRRKLLFAVDEDADAPDYPTIGEVDDDAAQFAIEGDPDSDASAASLAEDNMQEESITSDVTDEMGISDADDGENLDPRKDSGDQEAARSSLAPFAAVGAVAVACMTRQALTESSEHLAMVPGGGKKQVTLAIVCAAVLSLPPGLISLFMWRHPVSWLSYTTYGALAAVTQLVIPYHIHLYVPSPDAVVQFSVASTTVLLLVLTNAVVGFDADGGVSFLIALAYPLCAIGLWHMLDSNRKFPDFPDMESALVAVASEFRRLGIRIRNAPRDLQTYVKETREHRESWQLFTFLIFQAFMVVLEALYGRLTGSLGLLTVSSDTLLCCCALCISLFGTRLKQTRPPTSDYSYGFERVEPLCGFLNSVLLVFVGMLVLLESVERHIEGALVEENRILVLSFVGFLFNCLGLVFFPPEGPDMNTKGAYLHILGNTLTSLGLFLSTGIRRIFDVEWVDPVASTLIAVTIFSLALPLVISSAERLMLCVPTNKLKAFSNCKQRLEALEDVTSLQSFHVWALTSSKLVVSIRVVIQDEGNIQAVKSELRAIALEELRHAEVVVQVKKEYLFQSRMQVNVATLEGRTHRNRQVLL